MISKDKAIEVLKNYVKEGDSLFTTLNHVSQSGMMRHISVIAIDDNKPINLTRFVSVALDWKEGKKQDWRRRKSRWLWNGYGFPLDLYAFKILV